MSVWRRKAITCLPHLKTELESKDVSIYEVFSELLAETIAAHKAGDDVKLKACYEFAEWCLQQKEKKLWNAAGVSFYEHLGDQKETMLVMPQWVRREVYEQIRGLIVLRIGEGEIKVVDRLYGII
ncbi:DUF7674 family protein [Chitinophaga alhagiae]|uniref:DUF7674 family protein n=1 Tax=Chitinophaga alhagiae TaxID=2203219 RepID=UPI000E5BCABF|nr:hypothetical protein [Chitinophaga alhagiae]